MQVSQELLFIFEAPRLELADNEYVTFDTLPTEGKSFSSTFTRQTAHSCRMARRVGARKALGEEVWDQGERKERAAGAFLTGVGESNCTSRVLHLLLHGGGCYSAFFSKVAAQPRLPEPAPLDFGVLVIAFAALASLAFFVK